MYIYVYDMIKHTKNTNTTEQIVNENSIVNKRIRYYINI